MLMKQFNNQINIIFKLFHLWNVNNFKITAT